MSESKVEHREFQAEVRQILDIVINSLYTDREIFVRELVSNGSDALEKLRLKQLTEKEIHDGELALDISVGVDEEAKTVTITDTGIGMTHEELTENLGTIAHSGTRGFLEAVKAEGGNNPDVIGQFGVGFYSCFMVADRVEVFTRSWQKEGVGLKWESDGNGGYSIEEVADLPRGTKIVMHLKEDQSEFAEKMRIRGIIERYSNFVGFPVLLDNEKINKVDAIWLKSKSDITEEQYKEFYQFTAHAMDDPRYTMHFAADAPLAINSLVFVPGENPERLGMGPQPPGVALYCRKVLIDSNPEGLLPEWLRFLKGVIDSEDLPLNISRESMQDSAMVRKLGTVVTKRFLKFLDKQSKDDPEAYKEFYNRFSRFLKEGTVASPEHQEALAKLMRFPSSMSDEEGGLTSFPDYIERMKEGQEEIYYLVGPSSEVIAEGPHLAAFKERGLEVGFFTEPVDEYVLEAMREFSGKKLVSADRADIALDDLPSEDEELPEEQATALTGWMKETLGDRVADVSVGRRSVDHPVVALLPDDAPTAQLRAMMEAMGQEAPPVVAKIEVNPRHEVIKQLATLREDESELAERVMEQLTDGALLAAGLPSNPHQFNRKLGSLLGEVLEKRKG